MKDTELSVNMTNLRGITPHLAKLIKRVRASQDWFWLSGFGVTWHINELVSVLVSYFSDLSTSALKPWV